MKTHPFRNIRPGYKCKLLRSGRESENWLYFHNGHIGNGNWFFNYQRNVRTLHHKMTNIICARDKTDFQLTPFLEIELFLYVDGRFYVIKGMRNFLKISKFIFFAVLINNHCHLTHLFQFSQQNFSISPKWFQDKKIKKKK